MSIDSISIHPRVTNGRAVFEKSNTAKPWGGKGKLAKKQRRLHMRRMAHSATLAALPSGAAAAYRTPGSMNSHNR